MRDPDAILRLGHALAAAASRGVAVRLDRLRSAQRPWACLGGLTGQASQLRSLDRPRHPMLPGSSHHPLTIRQEQSSKRSRSPTWRAALGKALLERAGRAFARTAGATPSSDRLPGTSQGGPVPVAGPGWRDLPPQPGDPTGPVVRRCAGLIDWSPPARECHDRPAGCARTIVVGRNYTTTR